MIFSMTMGVSRSTGVSVKSASKAKTAFSPSKRLSGARGGSPLTLIRLRASCDSRLIREQRIDCVVCDTMYGGVLAARVRNVPVIFITNQNRFSGPGGGKNPVWECPQLFNTALPETLRYGPHPRLSPSPETVSEYNLLIPEGERQHYHFTGPFLDVDLSRYHFGQKTIFTSFGGEPYKLPLYRLLRTIADDEKRPDFRCLLHRGRSFRNPPTIIFPMGMCPTSTSTSPRHESPSSMAG